MQLNKVNYTNLNAKQKENYNFHKVAAALAEYGYNSMRLNDDWQGADFIAVSDGDLLKIQLKGRLTVDKKYLKDEDLYIAFIEHGEIKMYKHIDAVNLMSEKTKKLNLGQKEEVTLGAKLQSNLNQLLKFYSSFVVCVKPQYV